MRGNNIKTVKKNSDFHDEFLVMNSYYEKVFDMLNNSVWRSENTEIYTKDFPRNMKNKDVAKEIELVMSIILGKNS